MDEIYERMQEERRWREAAEADAQRAAFDALVPVFATVCAPLWRGGDGDGGHVLESLREAVYRELAWPWPPAPYVPRQRKATVKGSLRKAVFERDEYRCVRCGDWHALEVDHVIPEAHGGPSTLENLQTLCRPCNLAKGTRLDG